MSFPSIAMGEKTYTLRSSVIATVVEDGAVLLDLQTKYFYQLNRSAWAIVQLFETAAASREQIEAQCRAWGATDMTGVAQLLQLLESEALVEAGTPQTVDVPSYHGAWEAPVMARQAEPLQRLVSTAFDPSIPLAE